MKGNSLSKNTIDSFNINNTFYTLYLKYELINLYTIK